MRASPGWRRGGAGRDIRSRGLRAAASVLSIASLAMVVAVGGGRSHAATPDAGTIGPPPAASAVTWTGEPTTSWWLARGCPAPEAACDRFRLTVDVSPEYWTAHAGGALIEIRWERTTDEFAVRVFDADGTRIASQDPSVGDTALSVEVPDAAGVYTVQVNYARTVQAGYTGTATFVSDEQGVQKGAGAVFDRASPLKFGPATVVSAHFLGSEPAVTIERSLRGAPSAGLDDRRIFVDWPLGPASQMGQVSRSTDGGDSFRLLLDARCWSRSRPTCQTGGGADTATEVNPFTGTLFFADQQSIPEVRRAPQEALASSVDHGDTFPASRQFAVTNATGDVDREWLGAADPRLVVVGGNRIEAFMSYRFAEEGIYVQAIDERGVPVPQPVPQIVGFGRTGPIAVDNSSGPGRGWLYVPYATSPPGGPLNVATAEAVDFADPRAWQSVPVTPDHPEIFPWLDLDAAGNAYVVWVERGVVYYSASPIGDERNDPTRGGRPGTYWTPQLRLSLPELGSSIFAEVVGGDPGRMAIAYDGTPDHTGSSDTAPPVTRWHTYAAVVENALATDGPPVVHTGRVSHRIVHTGSIKCRGFCPVRQPDADDSLLDFIDLGVDASGRLGVVFTDNHSSFGFPPNQPDSEKNLPFAHFAKQVAGPSIFADAKIHIRVPRGGREDAERDATWPNTAEGVNLASLDVVGASIALRNKELVARIELADARRSAMMRDLATYDATYQTDPLAGRLQYVVRLMTADEIYHLSMESLADGSRAFFGGRLDENDRMWNAAAATIGATYQRDEGYAVTGRVIGNTIELRAPAEVFGLDPDTELFSVTAFAMAGPQKDEGRDIDPYLRTLDPMRTIDASPPFDALPGGSGDRRAGLGGATQRGGTSTKVEGTGLDRTDRTQHDRDDRDDRDDLEVRTSTARSRPATMPGTGAAVFGSLALGIGLLTAGAWLTRRRSVIAPEHLSRR